MGQCSVMVFNHASRQYESVTRTIANEQYEQFYNAESTLLTSIMMRVHWRGVSRASVFSPFQWKFALARCIVGLTADRRKHWERQKGWAVKCSLDAFIVILPGFIKFIGCLYLGHLETKLAIFRMQSCASLMIISSTVWRKKHFLQTHPKAEAL